VADAAFSKKRAAFVRSVLGSSMTCERAQNRTVPYEMGLTKAPSKLSNELHSVAPFGLAETERHSLVPGTTGKRRSLPNLVTDLRAGGGHER
jgi:hypothetical protein